MHPLRDLSVLDVGCGGGLFSEALARLGADVTGVDTSATAISVATTHAQADPAVASRTRYQNATAEQLQLQGVRTSKHLYTAARLHREHRGALFWACVTSYITH